MDPATLAGAALAVVTPYLVDAAKQAASSAGKAVWDWIKGKLTGEAGKEAVADLEEAPAAPENALALQAALTKVLKKEPEAVAALAELLKAQGVAVTTQTATAIGNRNTIIQASGNSSVKNG
ncbi:MAG: hypothetical protein WAU78_06020 [Roseiarcus sp.]